MGDFEHPSTDLDRYIRQVRFAPLGEAGQRRLMQSRALVCGCGALGSVLANTLVRAGVGAVRIVDRDFVELSNLPRQVLFDEEDAAAGLPKAIAAAQKLARINSAVAIEPVVADLDHANIERLCEGVDAIVDGTDNFETRFLINDAAVKLGIPWVYGGCLGADGQTMTILPGVTPCLRCLLQECPPPGSTPTCDVAGVLGPDCRTDRVDRGRRGPEDIERQPRRRVALPHRCRTLGQPHTAGRCRVAPRACQLPHLQTRAVSLAGRPARKPHCRALRPQRRTVDASRREHSAGKSSRASSPASGKSRGINS